MPLINKTIDEEMFSLYGTPYQSGNVKRENQVDSYTTKQITIGPCLFVCDEDPLSGATIKKFENKKMKENTTYEKKGFSVKNDERHRDMSPSIRVLKKSRMVYASSEVDLCKLSSLVNGREPTNNSEILASTTTKTLNTSASAPSLINLEVCQPSEGREGCERENMNPETYLREILQRTTGTCFKNYSALELDNFFIEMTQSNIDAYDEVILSAVRRHDIDSIRQMFANGKNIQCCNRFGESVVHMACRRGALEIVQFMIEEAGVSLRVTDDYGRTPLYDACWTQEPNTNLVKMIIMNCPDLLLIADKRGFTPLSYARRNDWGIWCEFLYENREILAPVELLRRHLDI